MQEQQIKNTSATLTDHKFNIKDILLEYMTNMRASRESLEQIKANVTKNKNPGNNVPADEITEQ